MKGIVFGATGMIGQGVLRECLVAPEVDRVLAVGRSSTGQVNPKLVELMHTNFTSFTAIESHLRDYDACFFCLGVSSAGMSEADHAKLTHDTTRRRRARRPSESDLGVHIRVGSRHGLERNGAGDVGALEDGSVPGVPIACSVGCCRCCERHCRTT